MRRGWVTTRLSEVAHVQSGSGFPERYQGQADGKIPFYKVSDMNITGNEREMLYENNSITEPVRRELGAFLFPKGSTIFPKIGGAIATNKKRLTVRDCCVDNNVMGAIPRVGKVDSDFLFYFFLSHDLSEFANEAHLPSIKKTIVESWPITLPTSLSEQRRIVSILDEALEGVATAKANAERNLENARVVFESHLQTVFSNSGDKWIERPLVDLCEPARGITYGVIKLGDEVPGGVPCLRTSNVRWLRIETNGIKTIAPALAAEYSRTVLRGGEVLVNVRGTLGGVSVVPDEMAGWNISREVAMVPVMASRVNPAFLSYLIGSGVSQRWLGGVKKGAAYVGINLEDLRLLPVKVPSLSEQAKIVDDLDELNGETLRLQSVYERKVKAFDELKASVLHEAFAGNL